MIENRSNQAIARTKLEELVGVVQQEGLGKPLTEFMRNGAPREQGFMVIEGKLPF